MSLSAASTSQVTPEEKELARALLSVTKAESLNPTGVDTDATGLAEQVPASDLKDKCVKKEEANFKPERKPELLIAKKDLIGSALIRFPLIKRKKVEVSTFTPTLFNYYEIVHYMDQLMVENLYYERTGLPWHPIVSRLYFGVIAYYQTLRAMDHAKIGTKKTRQLTAQLLKDLPPERLPIPGPLMPVVKTICCASPDDSYFRLVCPRVPDAPGPVYRPHLIAPEDSMLGMPNIAILLGLANSIISAEGVNPPDYTRGDTLDATANHTLSGYTFMANNWNEEDRSLLCQPGMHQTPETNPDLDEQFSQFGETLKLPIIEDETPLNDLEDFIQVEDIEWIDNIIPTMAYYSRFFKDSGNLGQCSPYGPTSPLLRSRPTSLTSRTAGLNMIFTLDSAFPDEYPYKLIYDQRSYELSIPNPYSLMGQLACINTRCDYRGMENWSRINTDDSGRYGPYWSQNPSNMRITQDEGFAEIENIISSAYYIESPEEN